jgi:hypothetical protein
LVDYYLKNTVGKTLDGNIISVYFITTSILFKLFWTQYAFNKEFMVNVCVSMDILLFVFTFMFESIPISYNGMGDGIITRYILYSLIFNVFVLARFYIDLNKIDDHDKMNDEDN